MKREKNIKQQCLFSPFGYMGDRRKRMIFRSWAGLFREEIMPYLPVKKLAACYERSQGRPSKELHASLGTLLLQQQFDLTDQETVEQYTCNVKWHYALHLDDDESDESKYLCERTLWDVRQKVMAKGLDAEMFYAVLERLRSIFPVKAGNQRLDSVHVRSNMKRLGRVRLFSRTVSLFLRELKKRSPEGWEKLPGGIAARYLSKEADQVFSQVKPSETEAKLKDLAGDLVKLLGLYAGDQAVEKLKSYQLMLRLYHDQCRPVDGDVAGGPPDLKKPREISGGSLQNPADPEAGYSGHKGQGYSAQIMETYQEDKAEGVPNLITYVEVTAADQSDAKAVETVLEAVEGEAMKPEVILADSLYGSDENCMKAESAGVEIVSPVMGQTKGQGIQLAEFENDGSGRLTRCPAGQDVLLCREGKKGDHMTARFDKAVCSVCPRLKECPVKICRRVARLPYTKHGLKSSLRRTREQGDVFRRRYRYRSGIEATMSVLDRLTGIKRLRVRGLQQVRYCVKLKAAGLNILRAAAAMASKCQEKAFCGMKPGRFEECFQYLFALFAMLINFGIPVRDDAFNPLNHRSRVCLA